MKLYKTHIYLAARYARHPEMRQYRDELELYDGIVVNARWIEDSDHEMEQTQGPSIINHRFAAEDLADIEDCDIFVMFTESPGQYNTCPTGGRHFEAGFAYKEGCEIHIIGPRENVFYYLEDVEVWENWTDFMENFIIPRYHDDVEV